MGSIYTCSKLVHRLWWIFHPSLHLSPPLPVNCSDPQIILLRMQISYLKFLTLILQWNNDQNKHFSLRQNEVMICVLFLPPKTFAAYATSLLCSSPDACCGVIVLIYVEEYSLFICYSVLCQVIICPSHQHVTLPALIFNSKLHSEPIVCCSCYFMYQCWSNACYPTIISFCGMIPSSTKDLTRFWFWYPDSCMMMNGRMFLTR